MPGIDMPVAAQPKQTSAFETLLELYRARGFAIRTGLNSYHFSNYRDAPFTAIYKDGKMLSTGGGISLQECFFLECLFREFQPNNVFVVGNAFGWSTLLVGLLNPNANVVAIDAEIEGSAAREGTKLTHDIAAEMNLRVRVVQGYSPVDVSSVVAKTFDAPIDFVFIDGHHTDLQQFADYGAIRPFCSDECVFLFHDVVNWNMRKSFLRISRESKLNSAILQRTPSGMGVLWPNSAPDTLARCVAAFCEDEQIIAQMKRWNTPIVRQVRAVAGAVLYRWSRQRPCGDGKQD